MHSEHVSEHLTARLGASWQEGFREGCDGSLRGSKSGRLLLPARRAPHVRLFTTDCRLLPGFVALLLCSHSLFPLFVYSAAFLDIPLGI